MVAHDYRFLASNISMHSSTCRRGFGMHQKKRKEGLDESVNFNPLSISTACTQIIPQSTTGFHNFLSASNRQRAKYKRLQPTSSIENKLILKAIHPLRDVQCAMCHQLLFLVLSKTAAAFSRIGVGLGLVRSTSDCLYVKEWRIKSSR